MMNQLAELVSSRARAEALRLLFGAVDRELHIRDLARQSGLADATVRQELARLSRLGLVERRRDGNRVYYRANKAHPLYPELRNIVLKTSGLVDVLRSALQHPGIDIAFVFGSLATGRDKPQSDVDLMVIGAIGLRQIAKLLSGLEAKLGREINPHVLTRAEFVRRRQARDHLLTTVLREPRLAVIGSDNELETMGR